MNQLHVPSWLTESEYKNLPVHERYLQSAAARLGTRETSRNSSRIIDIFLEFVGLGPGYAWCAAFVYWCLIVAGVPAHLLPKKRASAAVVSWHRWAAANKLFTTTPERGDIMLWVNQDGITGHMGFVTEANLDARVQSTDTIEGNTNKEGGREGNVVARQVRPIRGRIRYVSLRKFLAIKGVK